MQKIPLNLASPGMVLAKAVKRDDGLVIIAEKTELTQSLIGRLESMGIKRILVEGEPVDMGGAGGGTSAKKRIERLDYLFRKHQDRWMQKFKGLLKRYFQTKAAAEPSSPGHEAKEPEDRA